MRLQLPAIILENLGSSGASRREFVQQLGYRNISKGIRRLETWLSGEQRPLGEQGTRLCSVLGLTGEELSDVIERDKEAILEERRRHRALDPTSYVIFGLGAKSFLGSLAITKEPLPAGLPEREAVQQAADLACTRRRPCCLNTPASKNYWFNGQGDLETTSEHPLGVNSHLAINGRPISFQGRSS